MPYDVTIGAQLAIARPSYTTVPQFYAPYPWRAPRDGTPMIDLNDPDYPNGRNPLFTGLEKGELYIPSNYKGAADLVGQHSMIDYENVFVRTGTADISGTQVTLSPAIPISNFDIGSRILLNGTWYDVTARPSTALATTATAPGDATGVAYRYHGTQYRPIDPTQCNMAAIAFSQHEYASALAEYARRIHENGARPGIYASVLTHYATRIQEIIADGVQHGWRDWLDQVNATAKLKVHQGMSIIDIVNSYNGALFFPAYVPATIFNQTSPTNHQARFRRAMRRINFALRDAGANVVVPMFTPNVVGSSWEATGVYTRPASALITDLIADAEAIAPGEWGVWARQRNNGAQNECDATFIADLP